MKRFLLLFLTLTAVFITTATLSAQSDPPSSPFGVIESYQAPDQASDLNISWTRMQFHWGELQPNNADEWETACTEPDECTVYDQIDAEIRAKREVTGLLIGIPDWARDENDLPQGLWLPHDDPDNLWANFVRETVTRYDGRITHWTIWNEPDIDDTELAHTWDGDVDDFAQLQRVAYLVAKEANPNAIIHLPAFTYWADFNAGREQYMARLLDSIMADPEAADHDYYFDVATAHIYFQPNQIYDLLQLFQQIMDDRGMDKPIWLTETNAPPFDDQYWRVENPTLTVGIDEQANFIPQMLASAMAAGAERIAIFKLQDTESDKLANPEPFGLLRRDGSRRPAFYAYRTASTLLANGETTTRERWDSVGQIRIDQPSLEQSTTVLFSRLPTTQTANIPATTDRAYLRDLTGTRADNDIIAHEGFFTVELPPSTCYQPIGDYCMIGSPTFYLIQYRDPALPATAPTATPTAVPTATATALATETPLPTNTPSPTETIAPTMTATATSTPLPTNTPSPVSTTETAVSPTETSSNSGLFLLGGGVLMGLLIMGLWFRQR